MIGVVNERSYRNGTSRLRHWSRGSQTRLNILQAAYDLFLRQGYHGTSMRQIARGAGISAAAIYNHFPSKETIFTTLLMERMPQRAIVRALAEASGPDSETLVQDGLRRMEETMADQYQNLRLTLVELMEFQGQHAPIAAEEVIPEVMGFVERLRAVDGRLKPLSAGMIARAFLGLFVSYAITTTFFQAIPGLEVDPGDLQVLGDIFLHGVLRGNV